MPTAIEMSMVVVVMVVVMSSTVVVVMMMSSVAQEICTGLHAIRSGFSSIVHSLPVVVRAVAGCGPIVVIFWLPSGRPSGQLLRLGVFRLPSM